MRQPAASSVSTSPQPRGSARDVRRFRSNEKLLSAHNEVAAAEKGRAAIMRMKTNHRRTHYGVHGTARTVRRMRTRDPVRRRPLSRPVASLIETDDIMSRAAIFRQSCASPLPPATASARNFTTTTRPDNDFCPRFLVVCVCACVRVKHRGRGFACALYEREVRQPINQKCPRFDAKRYSN